MKIQYIEISYNEFTKLDCEVLFHDEKSARRFGIIKCGMRSYKFSWQSDLLEPIVKVLENSNLCCLGADLMFSIIDYSDNGTISVVKLDYFLYDIQVIVGKIWIITELEILILDVIDFNLLKVVPLPSFFQEIISKSPQVLIGCVEGERVSVELP